MSHQIHDAVGLEGCKIDLLDLAMQTPLLMRIAEHRRPEMILSHHALPRHQLGLSGLPGAHRWRQHSSLPLSHRRGDPS
jgi:hypothetical protein